MTTLYPTILHDKAVCVSKNEKCCTKTTFIKKNVAHVQHFIFSQIVDWNMPDGAKLPLWMLGFFY